MHSRCDRRSVQAPRPPQSAYRAAHQPLAPMAPHRVGLLSKWLRPPAMRTIIWRVRGVGGQADSILCRGCSVCVFAQRAARRSATLRFHAQHCANFRRAGPVVDTPRLAAPPSGSRLRTINASLPSPISLQSQFNIVLNAPRARAADSSATGDTVLKAKYP